MHDTVPTLTSLEPSVALCVLLDAESTRSWLPNSCTDNITNDDLSIVLSPLHPVAMMSTVATYHLYNPWEEGGRGEVSTVIPPSSL